MCRAGVMSAAKYSSKRCKGEVSTDLEKHEKLTRSKINGVESF